MSLRLARKTTEPLGYLADGTAFWAYFGSAGPDDGADDGDSGQGGEDDGDEDDDSDGSDDDDKIGDDGLTGRGRRAIEAERASAKRARDKVKPWNALQRELGMTPDQIREALKGKTPKSKQSNDDDAPDVEAIKRQAQAEAQQAVNSKLIKSAVRGVAAELLNDPRDAARYLDLSDYEVDDDGEVDEAQIKRDLRNLLRDKPYLGKSKRGDGRDGGSPDFDGGSRRTSSKSGMDDLIRQAAGVTRSRR